MSLYVTTSDINTLQKKIMCFANDWARKIKTPVPQKELISQMTRQQINEYGVIYDLNALLKKGYLKRVKVYGEGSKTFYKVLRSV